MIQLTCLVHGKPTTVELVKSNRKTCWVRLSDRHIIKRHYTKHLVRS